MEKTCAKCNSLKNLSEFSKREKGDGYQYICKTCMALYIREHYKRNKEYYINNSQTIAKRNAKWLADYKATLKCTKCGESHVACLEFHHLDPSTKEFQISTSGGVSRERAMREIKKCIVLCANCHKKLHYEEKESKKLNLTSPL